MAIDVIGNPYPTDPAAGVAGMRTLGTGAQQAAGGTHAHTGIPLASISATGTPSSTTFLRGDGSWSAAGSTYVSAMTVSDVSRTSSTYTADATLTLPLTAGTWTFDFAMLKTGSDIGASLIYSGTFTRGTGVLLMGLTGGSAVSNRFTDFSSSGLYIIPSGAATANHRGMIVVSGSGNLYLLWNSFGGSSVTLLTGSFAVATKIA